MRTAVLLALLMMSSPAFANHPGDRLDEVMAEKEPAFEPTVHRRPPAAGLIHTDGSTRDLRDLTDRIVVVNFVPDGCGAPCADQQALLAEVHEAVNATPMREIVIFVTVARAGTVPVSGEAANWLAAEPAAGETADTLAAAFARLSSRGGDAAMVHVIDRGGRSAGIFHGAEFGRVNMVLYINGLANEHPPEPTLLDRILGVFQ